MMRRLVLSSICTLIAALSQQHAAAQLPATNLGQVIVPHSQRYVRNGEGSLIELGDKSLLYMYGAHGKTGDWDRGEIRQIHSTDGGRTWTQPETVFRDDHRSLFQVSLARLSNGELGMTHTSLAHGKDAFKVFRHSADDGSTWSEPLEISDRSHAYMTGPWDKLYVLASGRVVALLHCNLQPNQAKQGGPLGTYVVYSDDCGKTWTRSPKESVLEIAGNPHKKLEWGFWEPSLVEYAPGKLLMMARTATGWLWESRSIDNGATWSKPVQSTVPNPVAPPVLTRVPDTELIVLIQNPEVAMESGWHGGARRALAFRTSRDGGVTWTAPTEIYRTPTDAQWADYPSVRWVNSGLHVVWRQIDMNANQGFQGVSVFHCVLDRKLFE